MHCSRTVNSSVMDYDKYYNVLGDGSYCIHFPNRKGLSVYEIKSIFSEYGNVLSVREGGDANGLRFIKYKTLHETISCLEGLKSHEWIRILVQKSKVNGNKDKDTNKGYKQGSQFSLKSAQNVDSPKNRGRKSMPWSTPSESEFSDTEEKKPIRRSTNQHVALDTCSMSSKSSKGSKTGATVEKSGIGTEEGVQSLEQSVFRLAKLQKLRGIAANTFSSPSTQEECRTVDDEMPGFICREDDANSLSRSSTSSRRSFSVAQPKIIPAQEVIVANVHSDFGIHYILHLFEKYDPISVSLMKTIPKTKIQYCHVYFKTEKAALATEKEFDNYSLSGVNLIVLRTQLLIEESTSGIKCH